MFGVARLLSAEQVTPLGDFLAFKSGPFQTQYLVRHLVKMPSQSIQKY